MNLKSFHLSDLEVKTVELANLQGFAPDLNECLINLGLRQDVNRVLDAEFITNMGILCTSLSIMATKGEINSDWRFSRFGILYSSENRDYFEVHGLDDAITSLNHTEFSLVIAIMACRENMLAALINGHKNPFRISLFYQNLLLLCLDKLSGDFLIERDKVEDFLLKHKRKELAKHEPYFEKYLSLSIGL